jgi:hypothetical protein
MRTLLWLVLLAAGAMAQTPEYLYCSEALKRAEGGLNGLSDAKLDQEVCLLGRANLDSDGVTGKICTLALFHHVREFSRRHPGRDIITVVKKC